MPSSHSDDALHINPSGHKPNEIRDSLMLQLSPLAAESKDGDKTNERPPHSDPEGFTDSGRSCSNTTGTDRSSGVTSVNGCVMQADHVSTRGVDLIQKDSDPGCSVHPQDGSVLAHEHPDLLFTDCCHVFHASCLLMYEKFHTRTAHTRPTCPVCRAVYTKRSLHSMQLIHNTLPVHTDRCVS